MKKNSLWTLTVAIFFAIVLISGGNFLSSSNRLGLLSGLSLLLLAGSFWRLRHSVPNKNVVFASIIILLGILVVFVQLIPLPPELWTLIPGRSGISMDLSQVGLKGTWLPLSLSPYSTKQDFLSLLPGFAAFFAVLTVPEEKWDRIIIAWVGLAIISIIVGLAQRFQGPQGYFNFFELKDSIIASGFFANHNTFAAQLYSAIPMIAVLVLLNLRHRRSPKVVVIMLGFLAVILFIAGVGATGSRMGALLSMLAAIFTLFLVFSVNETGQSRRYGIIGAFIVIVVSAQFCLVALLRFAAHDTISDYRGTIYSTSFTAVKNYFPIGSGFGTFVPVYQLYELPDQLIGFYVNHAHNDWLELLLEGGLPIACVILAFLFWYISCTVTVWRAAKGSIYAKAAGISIALILIHSFVDYPLRSPALMVFFAICCGMLANGTSIFKRPEEPNQKGKTQSNQEPISFRPRPGGFVRNPAQL